MNLFQVGKSLVNLDHVKKVIPWVNPETKEQGLSLHYIDKEVENLNSAETKLLKSFLEANTIGGRTK